MKSKFPRGKVRNTQVAEGDSYNQLPISQRATARYEIRLRELLSAADLDRFEGCELRRMPEGSTELRTPPLDQSALYGLLRKMRDSGMTLVSINPLLGGGAENEE